METEVKTLLTEYKKFTIELLAYLGKEDYDSLEFFMDKRQKILDEVSSLSYSEKRFLEIFNELGLAEYEQKLNDLLILKRDKIKNNINSLAKSKNANSMYNKNVIGPIVFSKKI